MTGQTMNAPGAPAGNTQVIIDRVVSRVQIVPGAGGLSEETVRRIIAAVLPAVQEMIAHQGQVRAESGTHSGYLDRIEAGGGQ